MAKKSLLLLNLLNLEPKKINNIIATFQDPEEIFKTSSNDLSLVPSLVPNDIEKILALRNSKDLDQELELIEKKGIDCLDIFDKDYPQILRQIHNPPLVIYLRGLRSVLSKFSFAIVGSRTPTNYGISAAREFSYRLASLGIVIVSGLARGIDAVAHKEALKSGETIAVLGSGLLNVYPADNKSLAEDIARKGAVISEFPLASSPLKENFPRRNRIVSGLSKGVLVVEAASRSGALVTARLACEQDREVFAIPGNIDSAVSKGTHRLIKEGAKLVDSLEDILEELNIEVEAARKVESR